MIKYILRFPKCRVNLRSLLFTLPPMLPSNGRFAALDKPNALTDRNKLSCNPVKHLR